MKLFDVFLIFASFFSVAAICPAQVSLVAHWKFDEASGANKAAFYPSGSGSNIPSSTTTVNDDVWHQVVGVYTAGGNAQIYVDGGLAEDTKTSPAMAGNSVAFIIDGITAGSTPTNLYEGLVDDVQLYSSALNQSNVAPLFANSGQTVPEPRSAFLSLLGFAIFARRRRSTGAH